MSWTPTALFPVPDPTPAPTVPVPMTCLNLATRQDVAPLPVSQIALLLPCRYAAWSPPQPGTPGPHSSRNAKLGKRYQMFAPPPPRAPAGQP